MGQTVQLTIPKACHEDWHTMTADQKGRYCLSCCKTVVDFTNMSDRAILHHIANAGGSRVCGRLHTDQLHRSMTIQKESRWPWLKYFFQFTLPAFLISMKAKGQEQARQSQDTVIINGNCFRKAPANIISSTIKGRVLDDRGEAVVAASIVISGTNIGTSSDMQGYFSIDRAKDEDVVLVVSGIGYQPLEMKIKSKDWSEERVLQLQLNTAVMGEVFIIRHKKTKRPAIEIARSIIMPDSVKLSPNPVGVGNDINVELNVKQPGNFKIEIFDLSGRMISKKNVLAETKCFKTSIGTGALLPGNYIVTVRNNKGEKIGAKKITIQN